MCSHVLGLRGASALLAARVDPDQRNEQQRVQDGGRLQHRDDDRREAEQHRAYGEPERKVRSHGSRERRALVQRGRAGDEQQIDDEECAGRREDHEEVACLQVAPIEQRVAQCQSNQCCGCRQRERVLPHVEEDLPTRLASREVLHHRGRELGDERRQQPNPQHERKREHRRHRYLAIARAPWKLEREELAEHHARSEGEEREAREVLEPGRREHKQRSHQRRPGDADGDTEDVYWPNSLEFHIAG